MAYYILGILYSAELENRKEYVGRSEFLKYFTNPIFTLLLKTRTLHSKALR